MAAREIALDDLPKYGEIIVAHGVRYTVTHTETSLRGYESKKDGKAPASIINFSLIASDMPHVDAGARGYI